MKKNFDGIVVKEGYELKMFMKPKLSLSFEMITPFGREESSALSCTTP